LTYYLFTNLSEPLPAPLSEPAGGEGTNRFFSASANEDRLTTSKLKNACELVRINLKNAFE